MAKQEPRRSQRLEAYDSNGRDYLSSALGWSRSQFEKWLYSSTVRPSLQEFYCLCIVDSKHFNESVDWINTGPKGYYYDENDLEEDLLFMCLCAGNDGQAEDCGEGSSVDFAELDIDAKGWITQELWARAAWRIVHANRASGQIFHNAAQDRPAAAYGFAIEMLCIIFHSIAFRGAESVYLTLLKGGKPTVVAGNKSAANAYLDPDNDFDENMSTYTTSSSSDAADRTSDATFDDRRRKTADSESSTIILPANAEKKTRNAEDVGSEIKVTPRKVVELSDASSLKTVDSSSAQDSGQKDPLTPDTSPTLRARMDEKEVSKHEQVGRWLEGIGQGQRMLRY